MMNISGLTPDQVLKSREKYGSNILPKPKLKTAWDFLCDVFSDKLNLILLGMAVVFIIVAAFDLGSFFEAFGIIAVLVLIAVINVTTGLRAQRYMHALSDMATRRLANVMRNGVVQNIDATDIVVGDIVKLGAGDTIPADGYLISGDIEVDNSVLNGESAPVAKTPVRGYKYNAHHKITGADYIDQNSLFAGTTVQSGRGIMSVVRVGMNTENGKILADVHEISAPKTYLDIQLDKLAAAISRFGVLGAVIVGIILIMSDVITIGGVHAFFAQPVINILGAMLGALVIALTIIAAAVPEGLPLIVSLIISQNAREMVRRNVLAKFANKIPAAGNINILCTDKTGTLTVANLTPVQNFLGDGTEIAFDADCVPNQIFRRGVILNGGASYDVTGEFVGGNATGRALMTLVPYDDVKSIICGYSICAELPFDSRNKYSATQISARDSDNCETLYMGAAEILIAHATHYMDKNGRVRPLKKATVEKLIHDSAARAMRMVATAYCPRHVAGCVLPDDLVLVCVTALRDQLRDGIPAAVDKMHGAHVQVIMITGDALDTATAIARDAHIMTGAPNEIAITADEMDKYTDAELVRRLPQLRVVARATPGTKLRLVTLAGRANLSIGMCGDGTNDAPALKKADIGFAMGSGTDVARAAADIIITDDNFVSITDAVLLGRTFMHNIRMFLAFQLPINICLMLMCLAFPIMGLGPAFWAVQILIINIIMDSLNSLAFGGEAPKPQYMQEYPMPKGAPLVTCRAMLSIAWAALGMAMLIAMLYVPAIARLFANAGALDTARFVVLVFAAMLNGLNIRAVGINPLLGICKNPMFILIFAIVIATTVLLTQFGGAMFHMTAMTGAQWLVVCVISALIIPWGILGRVLIGK